MEKSSAGTSRREGVWFPGGRKRWGRMKEKRKGEDFWKDVQRGNFQFANGTLLKGRMKVQEEAMTRRKLEKKKSIRGQRRGDGGKEGDSV